MKSNSSSEVEKGNTGLADMVVVLSELPHKIGDIISVVNDSKQHCDLVRNYEKRNGVTCGWITMTTELSEVPGICVAKLAYTVW